MLSENGTPFPAGGRPENDIRFFWLETSPFSGRQGLIRFRSENERFQLSKTFRERWSTIIFARKS